MCGCCHHHTVKPSHPASIRNPYSACVTKGLVRYYGTRHLHFITCSCYRRQPQLHTARCLLASRCQGKNVIALGLLPRTLS